MSKCFDHANGQIPMFLKPKVCDECEAIRIYRKRTSASRRAATTRANRATAQINGQPATRAVRVFPASELPKTDPWYRKPSKKA